MSGMLTTQFCANFVLGGWEGALRALLLILLVIALVVIARFVLFRLIGRGMAVIVAREEAEGRMGGAARARTLGGLLRSVTAYILVFVAALTILDVFDVNILAFLAPAGIAGLAVGFGAQKLVRDVISGFFILLENQYAVGEYVTIGAVTGVVEAIELRTTRLRDDAGRLAIISNGDISQVINHSRGALATSLDVSVAAGTDIEKAYGILRDVGAKIAEERRDVLGPFTCDGLAAMDGAKVTFRLVGRVEPWAQQDVQMDLRRRVRDALVENDIPMA